MTLYIYIYSSRLVHNIASYIIHRITRGAVSCSSMIANNNASENKHSTTYCWIIGCILCYDTAVQFQYGRIYINWSLLCLYNSKLEESIFSTDTMSDNIKVAVRVRPFNER